MNGVIHLGINWNDKLPRKSHFSDRTHEILLTSRALITSMLIFYLQILLESQLFLDRDTRKLARFESKSDRRENHG